MPCHLAATIACVERRCSSDARSSRGVIRTSSARATSRSRRRSSRPGRRKRAAGACVGDALHAGIAFPWLTSLLAISRGLTPRGDGMFYRSTKIPRGLRYARRPRGCRSEGGPYFSTVNRGSQPASRRNMRLRCRVRSTAVARLCRRADDRRTGSGPTIAGGNSALTRFSSRSDPNISSISSLVPLDKIVIFGEVRPCVSRAIQIVAMRFSASDIGRSTRITVLPGITI